MTKRGAEAFERQRGNTHRAVTFADVKIRSSLWCCRWCRAKAKTIAEIGHASDCQLVRYCGRKTAEVKT